MVATAKAKKESKEVYRKYIYKEVYRKSRMNKKTVTKSPFKRSSHYRRGMGCDLYHSQRLSSEEVNQDHYLSHLKGINHHGSQKDHLVRVPSTKKETFFSMTSPLPKRHFLEIVLMHPQKHAYALIVNLFQKGK